MYQNITNKFLNNKKPKSNNITLAREILINDAFILVDNKRDGISFDWFLNDFKQTKKCAKLLRKTIGGKIIIMPTVKCFEGISTCDFIWKRPNMNSFEKWDLKTVNGSISRTLDNMIKGKKRQSDNFIFDIILNTISKENAIKQIIHIFNDPHRDWVNKIMLIDKKDILLVYEKRHHPAKAG